MYLVENKLFLIVFFALSFFIIDESITYYIALKQEKNVSYNNDEKTFKNLIDAQSKNVEILAEALVNDIVIKKSFIENNAEMLIEHVSPIWENVKEKELTYEIHFFKLPAISFVNFSNIKSIGEDISNIRKDILWVISSFKKSTHVLVCKTYAGLRATHPILDDRGEILGSVSLGKKIDWLPKSMKQATGHESFLVYKKDAVGSLIKQYSNEFMKDKELVGNYILSSTTVALNANEITQIDFNKTKQYIYINKNSSLLYMYPIIDFNKNIIAYLFTIDDLKDFNNKFLIDILQNLLLILFTALIVIIIVKKRTNVLIKNIKDLKILAYKIQKRKFDYLHNHQVYKKEEPLVELEKNIIYMGLELEKYYNKLENENEKKSVEITKQTYVDTLTGLKNRNAFFKNLQKEQKKYIAILNIRNFKEINDAFGFETGNFILQKLADRLLKYVIKKDFAIYRLSSDEFIIKNNYRDITQREFKELIQKLIYKIEHNSFKIEVNDIIIDVRINLYAGICFDENKQLEKADRALAQAKKIKAECIIYTEKEDSGKLHLQNIHTIHNITSALETDTMLVYFQPIVDRDRKIKKYESLVRMKTKDAVLTPFFFLEISKRTKHYKEITKVVIKKTFQKFQNTNMQFSLNLTAEDIIDNEIILLLKECLQKMKNSNNVIFELTESDDLSELVEIKEFIRFVRTYNAKIAIDDFGTGYANFAYMIQIQPDYLKLDGTLIKNLDKDNNAYKIVETIIAFSKKLNIKTIAEFVHSEEIFKICKALGVDEFQGYYFGEPQSYIFN